MSELFMSLLFPVESAIAWLLAGLHSAALTMGLAGGGSAAWLAALVGLVLVVRGLLVPLTVRQVRLAHAAARARPALADIARRYAGRTDPDSVRRQLAETRAVRDQHGVSFGIGPMLIQGVVLLGLYRLLVDVAAGRAIGAMSIDHVAAARSAQVAGVGLADTLGGGSSHALLVVAILAILAVTVSYASTRWLSLPNLVTPTSAEPGAEWSVRLHRWLPMTGALGLLVSSPFVPAGVLLYWVASGLWTAAQQAAITRWAPTPGSPAHAAYTQRRSHGHG